jgi:hypothetical protein
MWLLVLLFSTADIDDVVRNIRIMIRSLNHQTQRQRASEFGSSGVIVPRFLKKGEYRNRFRSSAVRHIFVSGPQVCRLSKKFEITWQFFYNITMCHVQQPDPYLQVQGHTL